MQKEDFQELGALAFKIEERVLRNARKLNISKLKKVFPTGQCG